MEFEWLSRVGDRPLLYDVFSGAGGAARGYQQAGFFVVGIDNKPQKNYIGDAFYQMDALEFLEQVANGLWPEPVAIHTSPPCQGYSVTQSIHNRKTWKREYPKLIEQVRELLQIIGKPYVIENVTGAPLLNPLVLCGSMFPGLRVYRHRLFECNPPIYFPPMTCNHSFSMPASKGQYHTLDKYEFITCVGHNFSAESGRIAMQIDWMTRDEMAEAIPPAYTKWIGEQLLTALTAPTR